jgi:hypothetical protein
MEVDIYLKKVTENGSFAIFGLSGHEGMGKTKPAHPSKLKKKCIYETP